MFLRVFKTSNHLHLVFWSHSLWRVSLHLLSGLSCCCFCCLSRAAVLSPNWRTWDKSYKKNNNTTEARNQKSFIDIHIHQITVFSQRIRQLWWNSSTRYWKHWIFVGSKNHPRLSSHLQPSLKVRLLFLRRFEGGDCSALIQPDGLKTTHASHPRGQSACTLSHNHGSVENQPKWKETNIGDTPIFQGTMILWQEL